MLKIHAVINCTEQAQGNYSVLFLFIVWELKQSTNKLL